MLEELVQSTSCFDDRVAQHGLVFTGLLARSPTHFPSAKPPSNTIVEGTAPKVNCRKDVSLRKSSRGTEGEDSRILLRGWRRFRISKHSSLRGKPPRQRKQHLPPFSLHRLLGLTMDDGLAFPTPPAYHRQTTPSSYFSGPLHLEVLPEYRFAGVRPINEPQGLVRRIAPSDP